MPLERGIGSLILTIGRRVELIEEREIIGCDEPNGDGVFDEAGAPVAGQLARSPVETVNTDPRQFLADVVEFAIELRRLPPKSSRSVCGRWHSARTTPLGAEDRFCQCDHEQSLVKRERRQPNGGLTRRVRERHRLGEDRFLHVEVEFV